MYTTRVRNLYIFRDYHKEMFLSKDTVNMLLQYYVYYHINGALTDNNAYTVHMD